YVALSYCWGGPQPVETTKATLHRHLNALPMERLPQTIKDAIAVTRGLKVKYLWVDALCIIQDSLEDKAIEISRMTDIYNLSHVTISASTAATCQDGFLQQRKLEKQPIKLRAKFSHVRKGNVLLMVDSQGDEPIHKRGWTMQEHLLAPRLLSFGSLCLEYRCLSGRRRDGGTPLPWNQQQTGMPITEGGAQEDKSRVVAQWANIVEAYTGRGLGFLDDRLNAISGIARKFCRPELGEYLAGLISFELPSQLVWSRAASQTSLPRPKAYRAPSWSWAAIDGQVSF
ncbi:heterokaryon incompatibility protein-domain-containing protein, partial [Truncatella angustata]